MASKYYAVKVGQKPGIYRSWDECKAQVSGFSGAVYKSFGTLQEAEAYLMAGFSEKTGGLAGSNVFEGATVGTRDESEEGALFDAGTLAEDEVAAFVDGSYKLATREFSYGAVFFYQGEVIELSGKSDDEVFAAMRNVAGEIMGSVKAMRFALEKGAKVLRIYHDYEGIAQWCLGGWQAKNRCTQQYRQFYLQARNSGLEIVFHKVKGHSGVEWNERADALAKAALGIEK